MTPNIQIVIFWYGLILFFCNIIFRLSPIYDTTTLNATNTKERMDISKMLDYVVLTEIFMITPIPFRTNMHNHIKIKELLKSSFWYSVCMCIWMYPTMFIPVYGVQSIYLYCKDFSPSFVRSLYAYNREKRLWVINLIGQ